MLICYLIIGAIVIDFLADTPTSNYIKLKKGLKDENNENKQKNSDK